MPRGFLSEGGGRRETEGDDAGFVTVDLECGWTTAKAWGFKSGNRNGDLIWIPRFIKGVPLTWTGTSTGPGKLSAPAWLLTKAGLI